MYYNGCNTNRNLNDVLEHVGRSIINFDPIKGFNALNNNFSEIFNGVGEAFKTGNSSFSSKLDIIEDDGFYEVIVDLSGVNSEDVKILAKDEDSLEIKATRQKPNFGEGSNKQFIHRERGFGEVVRTVNFPKAIEKSGISAKWHNGELLITVPKVKPAEPQEIQIVVE